MGEKKNIEDIFVYLSYMSLNLVRIWYKTKVLQYSIRDFHINHLLKTKNILILKKKKKKNLATHNYTISVFYLKPKIWY